MDYRRGAFWNSREQHWMRLLNVNIRALIDWNEHNGDVLFDHADATDAGPVFFLSVQGADSLIAENNYGVRIFDSADLNTGGGTFAWPAPTDPTGLTVVSDQAIIVQGNYNSIQKFPAAVMGDAIYVLSRDWDTPNTTCTAASATNPMLNDLKSSRDLSTDCRDTTNDTTMQTAFLFGLGPSTVGANNYNGGLENFPKYLESWSGEDLNYLGSFVSLGPPEHRAGEWACGSGTGCFGNEGVYDPPGRNFNWDPDFNDFAWLPPMTPKIVWTQQRLFTRFFK